MWPSYLDFTTTELRRRADAALESLRNCRVCPRDCGVDRTQARPLPGERGRGRQPVCRTFRHASVSSWFAHFGEEDCLRGTRGSGTVFFGWCNLRCVFCQNWDTSQEGAGQPVSAEQLAGIMLELQDRGCHNLNWVTPEHVVPQLLEALPMAIDKGFRLPLVYNTSAYDSLASLRHLDGLVDIYMPDFKLWDPAHAKRYLKAEDYPEVARRAIKEMHRQVGPLVLERGTGLARRGLLVRHLVMPGGVAGTREIMRFLATEVHPDTYVNVMGQYRPLHKAFKYAEIARRPTAADRLTALQEAAAEGIHRFDERD
jgi:putative pyruvate formate lyase activating enzyme